MNSTQSWVTLLGVAVPLITLAGSAAAYVIKLYQDSGHRRRDQFFELMRFIDGPGSAAQKMAAIYELRGFPEHRDFVIRFCTVQRANVAGPGAQTLTSEMDQTRAFMESL